MILLFLLFFCFISVESARAVVPQTAWVDLHKITNILDCKNDIFYFGSSGCSDGNNCRSESECCSTITDAEALLTSGDCLLFKRGSSWINQDPDFNDLPNGTANAWTIVGSWGNPAAAMPIIQMGNCAAPAGSCGTKPDENFNAKAYQLYEDIELKYFKRINFRATAANASSHDVIWRRMNFNQFQWQCLKVDGRPGTNSTAWPYNFLIEDNRCDPGEVLNDNGGSGECFYISDDPNGNPGAHDVIIRRNHCTDHDKDGIDVKSNTSNILIEYNRVSDSTQTDDGGPISNAQNQLTNSNTVIRGNIVANTTYDPAEGNIGNAISVGSGASVYNNLIYNVDNYECFGVRDETAKIYHNTCMDASHGFVDPQGCFVSSSCDKNPVASIFQRNIGPGALGAYAANNVNGINVTFVNEGARDYRLDASDTAAKNRYTGILQPVTTDFFGTLRPSTGMADAGFHEQDAPVIIVQDIEDSYVAADATGTNFDSAPNLVVRQTPVEKWAYVKFNLAAITVDVIKDVYLVLTANSAPIGMVNEVWSVTDDSWSESAITWTNKPAAVTLLDTVNINGAGAIFFNVTDFVRAQKTGDGFASFVIKETSSTGSSVLYDTSEAGSAPGLLNVEVSQRAFIRMGGSWIGGFIQ